MSEFVAPINPDHGRLDMQMTQALSRGSGPKVARFVLSLLSGIPVAGGLFSGAAGAWSEAEQDFFNQIAASWMRMQEDEIREIGATVAEVLSRLNLLDEQIRKRLQSPEYLSILKKCFRDWSAAESEEKRILVRNLLTNAAANTICKDDVVRMFIQWIDSYSEMHFKVIRWIYGHPGCTRRAIWAGVHGATVREDSAEADMFKLLIRDLSTGGIARQHREKDYHGNFVKKARSSHPSNVLKSAFDDEERYELTELGRQFVRYTMDEVMPRLASPVGRCPNEAPWSAH